MYNYKNLLNESIKIIAELLLKRHTAEKNDDDDDFLK